MAGWLSVAAAAAAPILRTLRRSTGIPPRLLCWPALARPAKGAWSALSGDLIIWIQRCQGQGALQNGSSPRARLTEAGNGDHIATAAAIPAALKANHGNRRVQTPDQTLRHPRSRARDRSCDRRR